MRTETKWAIITTAVLFILMFLEKLLGWHTAEGFGTWQIADFALSILLFIVVYYMVTKEKRDEELDGVMSWKQGFWTAAIMTLIFIPLSSLVIYIFINYISPEFPFVFAEKTGTGSYGKDPVNNYMLGHMFAAVFGGLLFSLIFPLFTKKSA